MYEATRRAHSVVETDPVLECQKALGVPNTEQVFMAAAEDAGFTDPQAVAAHRYNQYFYDGYSALPPYVKNFCLRQIFIGRRESETKPAA